MKVNVIRKRVISMLIILAILIVNILAGSSVQVKAAIDESKLSFTYLNQSKKYLHLEKEGLDTFNFNINKKAKMKGATYSWYVNADKGNPNVVIINKDNGIVTAKEVGTAYIRCKVTLSNGTILRPEAKVVVRNNITEVDISNMPDEQTIISGEKKDFNRIILNTVAGKDKKASGITRWEIAEDTAQVNQLLLK